MTNRLTTNLESVGPVKIQDPLTESFIFVDTFQCAQLPQSFNNESPKIMRRSTITALVQVCASDSNKYHTGRFTIKYEVLADELPTGSIAVTTPANFEKFTSEDVKDTIKYILDRAEGIVGNLVEGNGTYAKCEVD